MSWDHEFPKWEEEGAEPLEQKKTDGWQVEERPPAGWMNWLFNKIWRAGKETQETVSSHLSENTSHYYEEENEEISLNFRNKFFYIDENNDVFFRPDGDGNAGSSLGEQGYINLWKVV